MGDPKSFTFQLDSDNKISPDDDDDATTASNTMKQPAHYRSSAQLLCTKKNKGRIIKDDQQMFSRGEHVTNLPYNSCS